MDQMAGRMEQVTGQMVMTGKMTGQMAQVVTGKMISQMVMTGQMAQVMTMEVMEQKSHLWWAIASNPIPA